MGKKKETIIVHVNQLDALLSLNTSDMREIISAMRKYAFDNEETAIPQHLQFGWLFFKQAIDSDNRRYSETCKAREEAGKKSGKAKQAKQANQTKRTNQTNQTNNNNNNNNNYNTNNNYNNTLSVSKRDVDAEREYFDAAVDEIVKSYPSCRPAERSRTVTAVMEKLAEDQERPLTQIVDEIVEGVKAYAAAVETWEEKRFVSDPEKFIRQEMYKCDPAVWARKTAHFPGKSNFDPMDPATWNRVE